MAKAPWFPFYTGDFLASTDVQLMEAHEVGAYLLLLAHSWQSDTPGYLPSDEGRLRRLARLSAEQWKESRDLLLGKWPEAEDAMMRCNPRLVKEAGKQVEIRELKAEAGRKSAERRTRLATEGQQRGNTNPTPVGIPATGVGENGNYSQSQPQSQSQEGKPSSSLRSEDAASAAAPEVEKKIEKAETRHLESPAPADASASHTRGAADVGTRKAAKNSRPVLAELTAYFASLPQPPPQPAVLAERFLNHYKANGWKIGRNPMKDWQATARNWAADRNNPNPKPNPTGTHANASNGAQQNSRYHTTRHAGGFGNFADALRRPAPGGVVAQPLGIAAAGGPADVVPGAPR